MLPPMAQEEGLLILNLYFKTVSFAAAATAAATTTDNNEPHQQATAAAATTNAIECPPSLDRHLSNNVDRDHCHKTF
jgi:hypothetical protein